MNTRELSERLLADTVEQLRLAEASYMRGFHLPWHYAGHPVGADARADLAFTLGLLRENGIRELAGISILESLRRVLRTVHGPTTHTFFSYRVAETLGRFGPIGDNELLAGASDLEIANLVMACDSTAWAARLRAGRLPRNYAAVLARCEVARQRLGIPHDPALLDEMLERTRRMLAERPGRLDDSPVGQGRYDLYSADTYLFCEPIADRLGPVWEEGAREMLDWVRRVASKDGCAMSWGRSTGALGVCHTIELGAMAVRRQLTSVPAVWLALAENAQRSMKSWFGHGGVTTAHQRRSSDPYRGPYRRLQLTFDILGKLAESARQLRAAPPVEAAAPDEAFPDCDELIWFDRDRNACVWSYRSRQLSFALPVTGGTLSDYLPAPRSPGLFEGQVGSDQPVAVPFVLGKAGRHVGAGLPVAVSKSPGALELTFEGWPVAGDYDGERTGRPLTGKRRVRFSVDGATFGAEERLDFDHPALAVGFQIAEAKDRPLRVAYHCPLPSTVTVVDTDGMSDWRSFWGELPVVHQLAIAPTSSVAFSWSMTPRLRVMTYAGTADHHYHRTIYDTLADDVVERRLPDLLPPTDAALRELVGQADVFHQHWPEWVPLDLALHRRLLSALEEARVPVLWTMHNLQPHDRDPRSDEIYRAWAQAAAAVAHHSHWGREQALARYPFRPDALHAVVPHPHFGGGSERETADRAAIERELGLRSGVLRLGIIGAPRQEKRIDLVVEAVRGCRRSDVELLILSLGRREQIAPDPRIRALPYAFVPRDEYDRRLATIDVLVLPFAETGMLTTGTVGDVVGQGLPALASAWPFLKEVLGEAAIDYGNSAAQLRDCLETLTPDRLARAAHASRRLRSLYDPSTVGRQLLGLLRAAA